MDIIQRARGSMAGLAAGDALGRPAEGMTPAQITARWGRIEGYVAEDPLGSDDTEYALLTAKALLRFRSDFDAHLVAQLWRDEVCTQAGGFNGGGFSEMAAVRNIARGLPPPRSGQHAHSWSDGLAMRVAPIGIAAAGNAELAARLAIEDGQVSHSGEGIHAGVALAAAIAVAMDGASADATYEAALAVIPDDSWTARSLTTVRRIVDEGPDWETIAIRSVDAVGVHGYFWVDLAPEAVSLAFAAVLAGDGDVTETILNAVNLGRDADTIAAMAGAVAGAMGGIDQVPDDWLTAVAVAPGVCLQTTRGMDPMEIADDLCDLATELATA